MAARAGASPATARIAIATTRNPLLRAVRNTALPLLTRVPALRVRLATEPAGLGYR